MKKDLLTLSALLFLTGAGGTYAQMVGPDAYMKGNYVEIGIEGSGGNEGIDMAVSPAPAGMHPRSNTNRFGFVTNPQMDGWVNFDGDFFTPGSPENGWGVEIGMSGGPRGGN